MRFLLFILVFVSQISWAASPTVGYPTATSIRLLKQNLDLNGAVLILSGTVDPTATATSAPAGSEYHNTSTGLIYRKTDNGSTTNWVSIANNQVVTATTAVVNIIAGRVTCVASPTIDAQLGSGFSSIVRNASGDCTLNFPAYGAVPFCFIGLLGTTAKGAHKNAQTPTTTTVRFQAYDTAGNAADWSGDVMCIGVK